MKSRTFLYLVFATAIITTLGMIIPSPYSFHKAKTSNSVNAPLKRDFRPVSGKQGLIQKIPEQKLNPKRTDIVFYALNQKEGIIGCPQSQGEGKRDNPVDNLFFIYTDRQFSIEDKVWLEYELYGLADYHSVSRCINDERTLGGWYIKKQEGWNTQSEQVNPLHIKKGKNSVRFSLPEDAKYSYKVRNIRLRIEPARAGSARRLVVNQPTNQYYYQKYGYLQGFVSGMGAEKAKLFVNERVIQANQGIFECLTAKPSGTSKEFEAKVSAVFEDGMTLSTTVKFNKACEPDYYYAYDTLIHHQEYLVQNNQPFSLKLGAAELRGDSGSVAENTNLSLTALRAIDMPVMGPAMVNVTAGAQGYRFLPHGSVFPKDLSLRIKYDTSLIPVGYHGSDVRTFYYDDNRQSWVILPLDTLETEPGTVASLTNHFTDFINAILKTPESPLTQAYTPTSIKELKAANPFEGLNLVQPPSANNMGSANLSFPVEVPSGRQGMQPNLAIQYNSGAGNGWLGVGWDLSIPAITVETRWGVPRYDALKESESYLMAGEQLTPMAHRDTIAQRNTTVTTKQFYPRVEGAFNRIIRHGTTPATYWWEVTDRNGITYYYGKYKNEPAINPRLVLRDDAGNIAHWALAETRDLDENYVKYVYDTVHNVGIPGGTIKGRQIYIRQIVYTGHGQTDGRYKVDFLRKLNDHNEIREDAIISGRYGFKEVTANLLKEIKISYNDTNIRSYLISYRNGAYNKKVICILIEGQDANPEYLFMAQHDGGTQYCERSHKLTLVPKGIKMHRFDYFDESLGGFSDEVSVTMPVDQVTIPNFTGIENNATSLSLSGSTSYSGGGGIQIGIGSDCTKKTNSIGGSLDGSYSEGDTYLALIDLNGDGLPDKVFKDADNHIHYRKLINNNGVYSFGNKVQVPGISSMGFETSSSWGWGLEGHLGFSSASLNGGYNKSRTDTYIPKYFVDINGDGLPDFINDSYFLINKLDANGNPYFYTPGSEIIMLGDDSCSFTVHSGEINDSVFMFSQDKLGYLVKEPINHESVRLWIAPYSGTIRVNAPIQLIEDTSFSRLQSRTVDGIRYTLQHNGNELLRDTIARNDYASRNIQSTLPVSKGDRIYFRLLSKDNRLWDNVNWNPEIFYSGTDTSLTDADGKKINKFKASGDFLLNAKQRLQAPLTGALNISGTLSAPPLSDTLIFKILKGGNVVYQVVFPDNSTINHTVDTVIPVTDSVDLDFLAITSSNIDFASVNCNLTARYNSTNPPLSSEILDNIVLKPILKFNLFQDHRLKTAPYTLTQTGTLTLTPTLSFQAGSTANGSVTLAVKKDHDLVALKQLTVVNNTLSGSPTLQFNNPSSAKYCFEYYTDNASIAQSVTSAAVTIGSTTINAGLHAPVNDTLWKFGNLYRGWGQFLYNYAPGSSINEALLHLKPTTASADAINNFNLSSFSHPDSAENYLTNISAGLVNPKTDPFGMMFPDYDSLVWRDATQITMVGASEMSNALKRYTSTQIDYDSPVPVVLAGQKIRVVRKQIIQKNSSWSASVGPTYLTTGGSHSNGYAETFADFMDINGDRFPDAVGVEYIQFTDPKGSLEKNCTPISLLLISKNVYNSQGQSVGGKYPTVRPKPGNSAQKRQMILCTDANLSLSTSLSTDVTDFTYLDVNGDGLPDKVFKDGSNYKVALNLGYKFSGLETWSNLVLKTGQSSCEGGSVGAINIFESSLSAGVNASVSSTESGKFNQDVNGDGLIDLVVTSSGGTQVAFNTGNGFLPLQTFGNNTTLSKNTSYNQSGSGSATVGFFIPLLFISLKFEVSPSASVSASVSKDKGMMIDINADGYPDYVTSNSEGDFKVRFNKLGKINLLKSVENSAMSHFELDYTLTQNSQKMPQRNWVLASVLTCDGHSGDGADYAYATFHYKNGYYSRSERQFMGFDTVITRQYNTQTDPDPTKGNCYRMITESYHNDNFLFKGIRRYELVSDCSNHKYIETVYTYKAKRISTGEEVPESMMNCYVDYYPAISSEDKYYYEGVSPWQIHTRKEYVHGPYGNVKEYRNLGDMTQADDNLFAYIQYSPVLANNQLGLVSRITVKDNNQVILRNRAADYNSQNGKLEQLRLMGDGVSFYEYSYDAFGNVAMVKMPEDASLQRIEIYYDYDNQVYTYPVKVHDNLGYESSAVYDYRFGKPLKTTDISGNEIRYTYNYNGRLKTIRAPYEIENNIPYTLKFEYWDEYDRDNQNRDTVLWARTRHYDPANPGNEITTVLFTDGLGRVLQTKKKTTVYSIEAYSDVDMLSVSGQLLFDAFSRTVQSRYPVTEGLNADSIFSYNIDNIQPTLVQYDILDRKTLITAPDNTTTSFQYSFGNDAFSVKRFSTKQTDANGIESTLFTDPRGLQTTLAAPLTATTKFKYNTMGELTRSTDPENNETSYEYDILGRRTARSHPDAGNTFYEYDPAGNLVHLETQNLSGSPVTYKYYYSRLTAIEYPNNPENNVYYEYYPAGSGNGSGQIFRQLDASGLQEFEYGKLGEVIKNTRTFVMPAGNPYTFEMNWTYDSWNRLLNITYPDGERVNYLYNNGGLLRSVKGDKLGQPTDYINTIGYDKFEKRIRMQYANQTYCNYVYNPVTLRLDNLFSFNSAGEKMQEISYTYDNVSNITQISNTAIPVNNNMGGEYKYNYGYDDLYRLISSDGFWDNQGVHNFTLGMEYSLSGNIIRKTQQAETDINGMHQYINQDNYYSYDRPHVLRDINQREIVTDWDANGNLLTYRNDRLPLTRNHCWDEENRLSAVTDFQTAAAYLYDGSDERVWKLTGNVQQMTINGQYTLNFTELNNHTLYTSPYMVINDQGYTKHYYIEGERICSKLGGGFGGVSYHIDEPLDFIKDMWEDMAGSDAHKIMRDLKCTGLGDEFSSINPDFGIIHHIRGASDPEEDYYFYHSDHLNSTSFISDANGEVQQHLQYLPFGELMVEQSDHASYYTPYKFSAKEKDEETGYSYFGARYYMPELSIWASVDPMSDERSWLSPYNYCQWNPIIYVDPTGMSHTNFEDENGNMISHVEDGSNAVFRLTGTNQTNSSFKFAGYSDQGGEDAINMAGLIAGAQDYVMNNYTKCNQAVNFVGRTYNSILGKMGTSADGGSIVNGNSLANTIGRGLASSGVPSFDKTTSGIESAVAAAAAGNLVVGTASGHVNMVTTQDFAITRYAKDGTSSIFNYKGGQVANVNGSTTTGLGPNKNNSYQNPKFAYLTKFYSIERMPVIHLPEIIIRP